MVSQSDGVGSAHRPQLPRETRVGLSRDGLSLTKAEFSAQAGYTPVGAGTGRRGTRS